MSPTTATLTTAPATNAQQFQLSEDHLAVLAHLPIDEARRFCLRHRRHLHTPDLATFVVAVARLGIAAYTAYAAYAGLRRLRRPNPVLSRRAVIIWAQT